MSGEDKKVCNLLPKQIYIIRHAEKEKNPKFFGCSKRGLARSLFLAGFFLTPSELIFKPDLIYCFNKHKNKNRSVQTATPLYKIGQYKPEQLNTQFNNDEEDTAKMLDSMFHPDNAGKIILCIWEHKIIPRIIRSIGDRLGIRSFSDFKVWSQKPWKGKDDRSLFSLVIIIETASKVLVACSQGDNFTKDESELLSDAKTLGKILFKM